MPRACGLCARELGDAEGLPAPAALARTLAVAFGFFHGGAWAMEFLAHPFCPPCRRKVVVAAVVLAAGILSVVAAAVRLWLRFSLG
ncbi:hypothetical protein EPO15_02180 [bacterium]|nr:MAG: hypothetical protein EPO15_02180 [bacterium]